MPIYEYRCEKCQAETEVMQKVSDPAPATCATCGATNSLSRLMSRTSFQLKGGGWYADLYSSTGGKKPAAGEASTSDSGAKAPAAAGSTGTSGTGSSGTGSSGAGSAGSGSAGGGTSGGSPPSSGGGASSAAAA